jgi:hypothetical protein
LALVCAAVPALAQSGSGSGSATRGQSAQSDDEKKALEHYNRSKELFQKASYREAIVELELARKLDPDAPDSKNLVMNLGICYEKLQRYDEAIAQLKIYVNMKEVTPAERTKAESIMKRLEAAKAKAPPPQPTTTATTSTPPQPDHVDPPAKGRVDALTIGAAVVAGVGLAAGTGLGVYALTQRPTNFVTGRDGTYATLQDKTDSAHTIAILADVGFGVGFIATIVTAWAYFGRTKDPKDSVSARIDAVPTPSGGVLRVGGTF